MAEEGVDQAIQAYGFKPARACQTETLRLVGAEDFNHFGVRALLRAYAMDVDVAEHLHRAYGDQGLQGRRSDEARARPPGCTRNIPTLKQRWFTPPGTSSRSVPPMCWFGGTALALLDTAAARAALPRVIALMASELGWSRERCDSELEASLLRLNVSI